MIEKEQPATLTARMGLMRMGCSRMGFAPRDTKDGSAPGTVPGEYVASMEQEPTVTRTTEVEP